MGQILTLDAERVTDGVGGTALEDAFGRFSSVGAGDKLSLLVSEVVLQDVIPTVEPVVGHSGYVPNSLSMHEVSD